MKKRYSKPFLAVESFQLDAAVASSCADSPIKLPLTMESCALAQLGGEFANEEWFGDSCILHAIEDTQGGICYQGFVDGGVFVVS